MDSRERLARRILRIERELKNLRTPQLGHSSMTDGAIPIYDEDDVLRQVVGSQEDGTYTVIDVNGPPPQPPAAPTVTTQPGLLIISSYGLSSDGAPWPLDFRRIDVHVGTTAGFETTIATRANEFSSEGGSISLALDPGTYFVKLVAISTSATKSAPSTEVSATVTAPATGADGAALYHSPEPPLGLGPNDQALWFDTDNGNLQSRWDGNSWEPIPLGPGATTSDVIAGKTLPLDTRIELQWGVPDPTADPFAWASMKPLFDSQYRKGGSNHHSGLFRDGSDYVRIVGFEGEGTSSAYYWHPLTTNATSGAETLGPLLAEISGSRINSSGFKEAVTSSIVGVVKIGTSWFVMTDPNSSSQHELLEYDTNWNLISRKLVGPSFSWGRGYECITTDGTNIILVENTDVFNNSAALTIKHFNPSTWAQVGSTITITGIASGAWSQAILPLGLYDFGVNRYVVVVGTGTGSAPVAEVLTSTGAAQATQQWTPRAGYLSTKVLGLAWNSTAAAFDVVADYGNVFRTSPASTVRSVWTGYTYYDSVADPLTHESALSPVSTSAITVPKRCGVILQGKIPPVDETQAPDTLRVYGRVGDASQPSKAAMDLQSSVQYGSTAGDGTVVRYVDQPSNGGAAPPTLSSFPAAPSGEIVSELGGLILRGDGTVDSPYLDKKYDDRYDARYATVGHDHQDLGDRIDIIERGYRPVGEVTMFYGTEADCPGGWLVMNGQTVSDMATRYPKLYAMLGNSTVVPDMRDRGVVGASGTKAKGVIGGSDTHTLAVGNLPIHSHTMAHDHGPGTLGTDDPGHHTHPIKRSDGVGNNADNVAQGNAVNVANPTTNNGGAHTHAVTTGSTGPSSATNTGNTGSGTAVNHQDKYRAMHFIIRAA